MPLQERLSRLGQLRDALAQTADTAQITTDTAAAIGLDVDRPTLVKIARGLRTLEQGG